MPKISPLILLFFLLLDRETQILPFVLRHKTFLHATSKIALGQLSALFIVSSWRILGFKALKIRHYEMFAFRIMIEWERATFGAMTRPCQSVELERIIRANCDVLRTASAYS